FMILLTIGVHDPPVSAKERISPTLSYRVYRVTVLTTFYQVRIYRQPRWFPVIQKEVGFGQPPCDPPDTISFRPGDITVYLGSDQHTLKMSCQYNQIAERTVEIHLD
ncbi:MAG: hypothetical protein WBQ94_00260, partial [Terracidiphilus sp.]